MRLHLLVAPLVVAACGDNLPHNPDAHEVFEPPCIAIPGEPALTLRRVANDLVKPVHLTSPPGDPRLFVVELTRGTVRLIIGGEIVQSPFLSLLDEIGSAYEQGLLSLAFHPAYADNGLLYVSWARETDDALVIEEWRVDADDPDRADPGSRRTLFEIEHSTDFHYGGHLAFGADGLLYISTGDGGPQFDTGGHAQDLGSLRGKLLRIDVDGRDGELPYAIPADNPHVGAADARGEVFAHGLRNPWRFTITPEGDILIGDVGFDSDEELDLVPAGTSGQNFGWPIYEGNDCQDGQTGLPCDVAGLTPPIYTFDHGGDTCAMMFGDTYRGCAMPGHAGRTFFGDFCEGWVRSFVLDGGAATDVTDHPELQIENVSGWGRDWRGELYLLDYASGTVDKIVPAVASP